MCRKKTSCTRICATAKPTSRNSVSGRDSTGFITSANGTTRSIEVDDGEHADPDQVQEVPEQAQARHAGLVGRGQAVLLQLHEHHQQPQQAGADVQAVGADQGEERRQEGTAVRTVALVDQVLEFPHFHAHEAEAQQPGDGQPQVHLAHLLAVHGDHAQAEGQRRGQQQRGFPRHERQLEQVLRAGAAIGTAGQHHIGGKQRGEDEAVAHQVDPEPQQGAVLGMVFARDSCAGSFFAHDLVGRHVVVTLVVEGMDDGHQDQRHERQHRQRPHVPDQRKAHHHADRRQHDAGPGVLRHVDGDEALLRPLVAVLLHLPPGIQVMHARREGEVVVGRGRRRGPFQRAAVPGISRVVA
ncbi:hypothetical protein G6F57_015660 [Rhizopus arrhizus]|nr:hypothetical protein G6F57_015660 [Rhizopus arrhizus]